MSRYAEWNKTDTIYTPSGKSYTAEEWKEKYSWINIATAVPVISGGMVNGAFIGELSEMKSMYEKMGADFSSCETNQDILDAIETFEDERNKPSTEPTTEERTAAALEFLAMSSMPDVE